MDDEKNFEVIDRYRLLLEELGAKRIEVNYDKFLPSREESLNHLLLMLPKMEAFIIEGRRGKFFRWLGFIQGVLWILGFFSLNDLRDHNFSMKDTDEGTKESK